MLNWFYLRGFIGVLKNDFFSKSRFTLASSLFGGEVKA